MCLADWFSVRKELSPQKRKLLGIGSFLLPILLWCIVSYVPFVWHPMVSITDPGDVDYFQVEMLVDKTVFREEFSNMQAAGKQLPQGLSANPIYLPAPHQVATALYTGFTTPPQQSDGKWLHESLWQSIQLIFWSFLISSFIGVPLGILCGSYSAASRLFEPFIEFFRYLPAPAFGALAVAILGIYDGPKMAVIVIGTLFQQILIIANTTRQLDYALSGADVGYKQTKNVYTRDCAGLVAATLSRSTHFIGLGLDVLNCRGAHWYLLWHHVVYHATSTLSTF